MIAVGQKRSAWVMFGYIKQLSTGMFGYVLRHCLLDSSGVFTIQQL